MDPNYLHVQLEDDLSGKMSIFDANMSTCVLFLSIFVLLLLLTFLTFRVSSIFHPQPVVFNNVKRLDDDLGF
jgi:hypothetical protein